MSETLTDIKSAVNSKVIKGNQYDQCMKYSVFEDVKVGSKQNPVAFIVYNLAI